MLSRPLEKEKEINMVEKNMTIEPVYILGIRNGQEPLVRYCIGSFLSQTGISKCSLTASNQEGSSLSLNFGVEAGPEVAYTIARVVLIHFNCSKMARRNV